MSMIEEHGFVGNIWVRQNFMEKAGDTVGGHVHYHDHVSLLAKGKVSVQIDDGEPKEFVAPTFIVVRKEHKHRITALEDGTVWYCVFAMRDIYGDVTEIIDEANVPTYPEKGDVSKDNPPLWSMSAPDDYWNGKEINRGFSKSPSVGPTWVELDHDHAH